MLRRALTTTLAVAALALATSGSAAAVTRASVSLAGASAENDLIALLNSYRAENELQPVVSNGALTAAAAWMAADMAAKNYIGHVSSDGRSPMQRMSAFGYPATSMYTGEDLGVGYGAAGAVLAGWQASAAHNAVLLNPNYNAVGVGLVYNPASTYKWYWAADFGGPGGTVKIIVSPPAPRQLAPAGAPGRQPVTDRVAPAPRASAPQPAEDTVDAETAARAARAASIEKLTARRIAHLFAVLERMGAI